MAEPSKLTDEAIAESLALWAPINQMREDTEPRAVGARYDQSAGLVMVTLRTGAIVSFAPTMLPWLVGASAEAIADMRLLSDGEVLEWPSLDEGTHVPGLVLAVCGSQAWRKRLFDAEWEALQDTFPAVAAAMGRKGGAAKTARKTKAAQMNGKKGGRPRKSAVAESTAETRATKS